MFLFLRNSIQKETIKLASQIWRVVFGLCPHAGLEENKEQEAKPRTCVETGTTRILQIPGLIPSAFCMPILGNVTMCLLTGYITTGDRISSGAPPMGGWFVGLAIINSSLFFLTQIKVGSRVSSCCSVAAPWQPLMLSGYVPYASQHMELQQLFGVLQLACNQTYFPRDVLAGNWKTSQKTSRIFIKTTNVYIS